MFKNIKSFNIYSLIAAILLYISAAFIILAGLVYLGFTILGSLAGAGTTSQSGVPMFVILYFGLIFLFVALIYISLGVTSIFIANHYLKRSNEAKKLIDNDDKQEQLLILKEIERHEFWIERLMLYPANYISSLFMIFTIVLAPIGIINFLMTKNQIKMDKLKDKYNFTTDTISQESKIENSNEIFGLIQKSVKYQVWIAIVTFFCSIAFFAIIFTYIGQLNPNRYYQQNLPGEYQNVPSEFKTKPMY